MEAKYLFTIENLTKKYMQGEKEIKALDNVNLNVKAGEDIAIIGPSGSGKSTLLKVIACLINYDSGKYIYKSEDTSSWSNTKKADFRNSEVGMVVQDYALLEGQDAYKNVSLPFDYSKKKFSKKERTKLVKAALAKLGIEDLFHSKVNKLSGGQRQRVAIARAIIMQPKILLADEPTGALDSENGEVVSELLHKINDDGTTLIIATHNLELAKTCSRIIKLKDGKLVSE